MSLTHAWFSPTSWRISANHSPRPAATIRSQSTHNASHFRMIQPPRACLTSLHVGVHSGPPLSHISQLPTKSNNWLARCWAACSHAHACSLTHSWHTRPYAAVPHAREPLGLMPARPQRQSCELLRTPPTHIFVRAAQHCLRPCRSVHSTTVLPCFRAHHKHAHCLSWLGTRPPSQATAVGPHGSRWWHFSCSPNPRHRSRCNPTKQSQFPQAHYIDIQLPRHQQLDDKYCLNMNQNLNWSESKLIWNIHLIWFISYWIGFEVQIKIRWTFFSIQTI